MCDAVVPDVKPLNVTSTCNVLAVGSRTTVAKPVPGVVTGGISAAPVRLASNVIGTASAAGGRSARAEIMIIADRIFHLRPPHGGTVSAQIGAPHLPNVQLRFPPGGGGDQEPRLTHSPVNASKCPPWATWDGMRARAGANEGQGCRATRER